MKNRIRYNWEEIQKYYDEGHSWRDIESKFGVTMSSMGKAQKRGDLKSRSKSMARKLASKKYPQTHTEETKRKLSKIRKEFLKKHPEKVPYLLNHHSYGESFPEKYFRELFEAEKIDLKYHLQVGLYQLDFYNLYKMIDIEIDGEQHYVDNRIVESDKKRTEYLESEGWKVFRIRWSEYQKKNFEGKKKIINEIKNIINNTTDLKSKMLTTYNLNEKRLKYNTINNCIDCGKQIGKRSKRCQSCAAKKFNKRKIENRPSKEILLQNISKLGYCGTGRKYGVSDNCIRKWLKSI